MTYTSQLSNDQDVKDIRHINNICWKEPLIHSMKVILIISSALIFLLGPLFSELCFCRTLIDIEFRKKNRLRIRSKSAKFSDAKNPQNLVMQKLMRHELMSLWSIPLGYVLKMDQFSWYGPEQCSQNGAMRSTTVFVIAVTDQLADWIDPPELTNRQASLH